MFNPHTYDNSTSAGTAFMEVIQYPGSRETSPPLFMPLRRTRLTGTVTGPLARLSVEHIFQYPASVESPVLEAVYRFPLPGDAAVTGVRVFFGEVEIRAELAERDQAENEYDLARESGRQAVLLTRESPDVFSLHVSGIEAGQDVRIHTDFVQLARTEGSRFSLRIPLTPAPRYTSYSGGIGRHAQGQPLALANDPGHRVSMDIDVQGSTAIESRTHELSVNQHGETMKVSLAGGDVVPDRDLVIEWRPSRKTEQVSLQVLVHQEDGTADESSFDYFLALVNPPETPDPDLEHPREIVLLVDRSGSMSGPKWEAADWATRLFLSSLNEYDSFSIGLFHWETRWFAGECLTATEDNLAAAYRFIESHQDSGGTELGRALDEALRCGRSPGRKSRHVVIITDAQVSNDAALLELARTEASRPDRRRISMLCIDAAPNSHLVHELVAVGGGRANFLTSDPEQEDISTALDDLLSWWDEPADTGLSLVVNRPDAWVMGRKVDDQESSGTDVSRIDLGDLPPARSTWVVGRVPSAETPIEYRLERSEGEIVGPAVQPLAGDPAIKTLFGAKRLLALEYQLESMVPRRYRHRAGHSADEKLRQLLVSESLYYGLACSETSFVAVRQEAGKRVERGAIVPNALPYGWEAASRIHARTAASHSAKLSLLRRVMDLPASTQFLASEDHFASDSYEESYKMAPTLESLTLFDGVPNTTEDGTILYETDGFEHDMTFIALTVQFPDPSNVSFDGVIELFVGNVDRPRARVRISDLLRQGGIRPLNVRVRGGQPVRVVLSDVSGTPAEMTVEVDWRPW